MRISLLIPFRPNKATPHRSRIWRWLRRYWRHELPEAEIVVGHSCGEVFSKSEAINDAASRAKGEIFVIMDSDAYLSPNVILRCAAAIEAGKATGHNVWFMPYRHLYRLTEAATEKVLTSSPYHPYQFPLPPNSEDVESTVGSEQGHYFGAMVQIMPREAFEAVGCWDPRFCVDTDTQILTSQGWRTHTELQVGDLALTLNHDTGLSEWHPVQAVNIFPEQTGKMMSMESKMHSSLTTLNHKWPVVRRPDYRPGTGWGSKAERRIWATSATMLSEDRVPVAADCADLPTSSTYSDAVVELVGWFWTEGHIPLLKKGDRLGQAGRPITLSQSLSINPENCLRIKTALEAEMGPAVQEFVRRGASLEAHLPQWRDATHPSKPDLMTIVLNAEGGELLQSLAPDRVPTFNFLRKLTKQQLNLFIEVSLLADRTGERELAQKNPKGSEAFQFACILAGYGTSIRERSLGKEKESKYGYKMTNVTKRTARTFGPHKGERKIVDHHGIVWCPTVTNGTWLARRNGTTYFTGNTGWGGEDVSFLLAVDTLWGKHKSVDASVFHLWHPTYTTGHKYTRLWEGQTQNTYSKLASRYRAASGDYDRMRMLVEEGCEISENCDCAPPIQKWEVWGAIGFLLVLFALVWFLF